MGQPQFKVVDSDSSLAPTTSAATLPKGPDGPYDSGMEARIGKLETAVASLAGDISGLKTVTGVLVAVVLGGFAFFGFQTSRVEGKLDTNFNSLSARVNALPGEINRNLLEINRTLSDAITAARSAPPQVIVIPSAEMVRQAPPPQTTPFDKFVFPPKQP